MNENRKSLHYAVIVLCLCGAVISAFLVYEYAAVRFGPADYSSFCNINESFNCDKVAQSKWSSLAGIPIASYGLAFYLSLFLLALLSLDIKLVADTVSSSVFTVLAFLSLLLSLGLFAVSKLLVGSFCLLCMGLYLVNILLFASTIFFKQEAAYLSRLSAGIGALWAFPLLALGLGRFSKDERRPLVETALLTIFIISFFAYSLPWYFVSKHIAPPGTPLKLKQQPSIEQAVKDWKNAPPVKIDLSRGSALSRDYSKGPSDATVEILIFSDIECPVCRKLHLALPKILKGFEDKVSMTFKNYPLDRSCNAGITSDFHRYSCLGASFTRCAGEQDKYWEALDALFELDQYEHSVNPQQMQQALRETAISVGLDTGALFDCINSERQLARIKEDIRQGDTVSLKGTPTIYINGRLISRVSVEGIRAIIEEILRNSN